jgi:hypothetical protein
LVVSIVDTSSDALHPLQRLKREYFSYTRCIVGIVEASADSWLSSAVAALMDYSPLQDHQSYDYIRRELFASAGEAFHKFATRVHSYPGKLVGAAELPDDELEEMLATFLATPSCDLDPFACRPAQLVIAGLHGAEQQREFRVLCKALTHGQRCNTMKDLVWKK